MSLFPASKPFQHHVFESAGATDSHGNSVGVLGDAVDRVAIAWYQINSLEPISADYVDRTITDVSVLVDDPTLFHKQDVLILGGQAFEVIGVPADWSQGPWAGAGIFGGEIHARRVD